MQGSKKSNFAVSLSYPNVINPTSTSPTTTMSTPTTTTSTPTPTTTSTPTTTTNPTTTSTPAPTGGPVTGVTIGQIASALDAQLRSSTTKFVENAATIEENAPTLGSNQILTELKQIATDLLGDSREIQIFSDLQTLGATALAEARIVVAYGLPTSNAILAYTGVVNDLENIDYWKSWTYSFVNYLNNQNGAQLEATDQNILGSGVFVPSSGGDDGSSLGTPISSITGYTPYSLASEYSYYQNVQANLPSAADYYYDNYDYSTFSEF